MFTQVSHGQLVNDKMAKIGLELNIKFDRPSIAKAQHYPSGKWLYDEYGSSFDIKVSRWGTGANRIVKGPIWSETSDWSETYDEYSQRLEVELRSAVRDLIEIEM